VAGAACSRRRCVLYLASNFGVISLRTISPNNGRRWFKDPRSRVALFGDLATETLSHVSSHHLFKGAVFKSGTFCLESQPDGRKSGYNHFHRTNTPATGDTSMHGAKGEEGYWLKHVAVAEFDDEPKGEHAGHGEKTHYKPGQIENMPQPTTPKCK
jgi:hypothetical protein